MISARPITLSRMNPAALCSILLFGGSFDPPHRAHTEQARLAMEAVGADAVAFIPAGRAPHKAVSNTSPQDRLAMVQLAVESEPRFFVVDDEVRRANDGKPSYTVDTLAALREKWGERVRLRLLIGADMLRIFHKWREPARITQLAEPLVIVRPPDTRDALLASLAPDLPGGNSPAIWGPRILQLPPVELSSTLVRDRVKRGEDISDLVAPPVARYIRDFKLYLG